MRTRFVAAGATASASDAFEASGIRRLRVVATVLGLILFVSWLGLALSYDPTMADELSNPLQWGPPVVTIVCSLIVVALTHSSLSVRTLLTIGLGYQIVVAYGLTFATQWGAFEGIDANTLDLDLAGLGFAAPWMIFYASAVPTKPRATLVALLASATAPIVVNAIGIRYGHSPQIPFGKQALIFGVPHLICAALGYSASRVIHRLGEAVTEARRMGSYQLESLLGEGGMGEVWRASHQLLARPAAVKLIRPSALSADPERRRAATARFEQEAQVTAQLDSPHTVELYDFGTTDDGTLYYVMELLDGLDLEQLVNAYGPVPSERAVHILRQACASLAEAHVRGLVHRDIKPANLYLCRQGMEVDFVKVLDFGLVKPDQDRKLTATNVVAGTPTTLAPEAILDGEVDARADLYALGCVAYWLLTGRTVFEAKSATAMAVAHVNETPRPPSAFAAVSPSLDELVLRCLEKSPADRPASAEDLAMALGEVSLDLPWTEARAQAWWDEHQTEDAGAAASAAPASRESMDLCL